MSHYNRFSLLSKAPPPPIIKPPKHVLILGGVYLPCEKLVPKPPSVHSAAVPSITNLPEATASMISLILRMIPCIILYKSFIENQRSTLKSMRSLILNLIVYFIQIPNLLEDEKTLKITEVPNSYYIILCKFLIKNLLENEENLKNQRHP